MELDQLKDSWKALEDAPPMPADLTTLLERAERAAARPLHRMKKNIIRESIFIVVVYALAYSQFQGPMLLPLGIFYLLMLVPAFIYYIKKYRLLISMETIRADENVLESFTNKLLRLRGFLRFYLRITYVLMFVVMWFVCWLLWAYKRPSFYSFFGIHFHTGQELWVIAGWTLFGLILLVPAHYLGRWAAYCYYGRYVDELEENLRELSQI